MKPVKSGMTIVELLIVIVVIGLLAGLGVFGYSRLQESSTIKQHRNTAQNLTDILNEIYTTGFWPDGSTWTKGHYPTIHELNNNLPKITNHHTGVPKDLEIMLAASHDTSNPMGSHGSSQEAIEANYAKIVYQPIDSIDGMVCQESDRCNKFNIYYFLRDKNGNFIISEPIASKYR